MMNDEAKPLFAIGKDEAGKFTLIIGFSNAAWNAMQDGKCLDIDLAKTDMAVNGQLIMFGGPDHATLMQTIEALMNKNNVPFTDDRDKNFAI